MAIIPFRAQIDAAFRHDRRLWPKLIGAAVVGLSLSAFVCIEDDFRTAPWYVLAMTSASIVVACCVVVLALAVRDVVKARLDEGQSVPWLLRLYLASGLISFFVWMFSVVVVAAVGATVIIAMVDK